MKKKLFLFFLLFSFFVVPVSAAAETIVIQNVPGGVQEQLKTEEYDLDSYQSYLSTKSTNFMTDEGRSGIINNVANIIFGFSKIFYEVFDHGINFFSEKNVISQYVNQFTGYSKKIYKTLYAKYGLTIIVCMVIYCCILYITKGERRALTQFFTFMAIFLVGYGWNERAVDIMNGANSITTELQADLMNITSDKEDSNADPTIKVRNALFEMTVEETYYLLNYGVTSESKINTKQNPKRSETLLVKNGTESEYKKIKEYIAANEQDNKFLSPDKAGWKFSIALISIPMTLIIGVPMFMIQLFSFVLQMIALLLSVLVGIAMFLSLIPFFQSAAKNTFKYLFSVFGLRAAMGLTFSLLVLIVQIGRIVVPATDSKSYMLQAFVIFFILYVCWKFRNQILTIVTGGRITSVTGGLAKGMKETVKEVSSPVTDTVSTIGGFVIPAIGAYFSAKGATEETEETEETEGKEDVVEAADLEGNNEPSETEGTSHMENHEEFHEKEELSESEYDEVSSTEENSDRTEKFESLDTYDTELPEYQEENNGLYELENELNSDYGEYLSDDISSVNGSLEKGFSELGNQFSNLEESEEDRIIQGTDTETYEEYKEKMYGEIIEFPQQRQQENMSDNNEDTFLKELEEVRN
ncbi:CD3337/EF1877 family mobilome membrane protein [Enterococcus sp. LJL128]